VIVAGLAGCSKGAAHPASDEPEAQVGHASLHGVVLAARVETCRKLADEPGSLADAGSLVDDLPGFHMAPSPTLLLAVPGTSSGVSAI
jgi:hypothetical protein